MDWTNYADARPEADRLIEWRMPHLSLEGAFVLVLAKMRLRGAGYESTYSPPFDYWDGYRLHVPKGLQWRYSDADSEFENGDRLHLVGIEGLTHCECPYCGKLPKLKAIDRSSGGVAINPDPNRLNMWWLECCAWGKTPSYADPRQLEADRRAGFAKAASVAQEGRKNG